ncbi:hypothetical protein LCM27_15035 [Ruegeria marisrubri]|nr:hypothetical protein [Ruegeria marisrubri]
MDMLADAARLNMGVAVLPRDMLGDGMRDVTVKGTAPAAHDMFAVYPSRLLLPARVRALIDFMTVG